MQLPKARASSCLELWFEAHYMVNPHAFSFYVLAKHIHPLAELEANTPITPALSRRMVDVGFMADWFELSEFCSKYLPSSAKRLKAIQQMLKTEFLEPVAPHQAALGASQLIVDEYWAARVREAIQEFETILQDEVSKLPIFCCDDNAIGNFSVAKLMKGASKGYPEKTRKRLLPECQREIDEAGRCLVYERSTAAGFHILRSVELSIKQYLMAIPGFTTPPLNRQNWGEYLKLLKDNGAGRDVTDHLHNIKDNYRNPLMHPEDTLEADDAVSLFAVAQSMNEMLVTDMLRRNLIQ